MRQEVRWTDLTYGQIAGHLAEAGTPVSVPVVKQLLKKHGYVTRKAQKSRAMGSHPDRNRQFENIARLKQEYLDSEDPIVSMDTKKKELIGNFYRAGRLLTQGVVETFDHDFPPSRVTWTFPSSVPIQITLVSNGDGAMLNNVVWNSAAVLSVTICPPEFCCFFGSLVVRSGEITSHELPKSRDRKSTLPPKYTVPGCSGVTAIGEFQLNRYL